MVNHFYTLLVNEDYVDNRDDLISVNFNHLVLPDALRSFHNIIIPRKLDHFFKCFLGYAYLNYVDSCGLHDDTLSFDPRITYDLNDVTRYYKFRQVFSPALYYSGTTIPSEAIQSEDAKIKIVVTGTYRGLAEFEQYNEIFKITQDGGSHDSITVESIDDRTTQTVLKTYVDSVALSFDSTRYSQKFVIGDTGLTMQVYDQFDTFTTTENKFWFTEANAPIMFTFSKIYNNLISNASAVSAMLNYVKPVGCERYDTMWNRHFNKIYKFSGLLLAYAHRANYVLVNS